MRFEKIKYYLLPNQIHVVSYFDNIKRVRILKEFESLIQSQTFLNKLKAQNTNNQKTKSSDNQFNKLNIEELMDIYLKINPKSSLRYSQKKINLFLNEFSSFKPHEITKNLLHSYFIKIKNEEGYANKTLLSHKYALNAFFDFLIEKKLIIKNELESISFERYSYKRFAIILSQEEFLNILNLAKTYSPHFFYPMFLLIYETAAKREDIFKLLWKDIDFKNQTITFPRSNQIQPRTFDISNNLTQALKNAEKVSSLVFTNVVNQPLAHQSLGRELQRFKRRTGINSKWVLSDLRTTYAVHFLKRTGNFKGLQKILGHQSHHVTIEAYSRYLKAPKRKLTL